MLKLACLLISGNCCEISEYGKYRLVGDEFKNDDNGNGARAGRIWMSLIKGINGSNEEVSKVWTEKGDRELLGKALLWIYLSYPYAKFHGEVLNLGRTAMSETSTGAGKQGDLDRFGVAPIDAGGTIVSGIASGMESIAKLLGEKKSFEISPEFKIWADVGIGAGLLAIMPPMAIPFLINVPMDFLYLDVGRIMDDWNENMGASSSDKDPILKLQNLGTSMVENSLAYAKQLQIYFGIIAGVISAASLVMNAIGWGAAPGSFWSILLGLTVAAGVSMDMYNSVLDAVQTIIFMQLPVALAFLGPIFISGIVFSIYVPLLLRC